MSWPRQTWARVLIILAFGGVVGIGIFGTLAWCATSIETALPPEAAKAFDAVTLRFQDAAPRIILDAEGRAMRNPSAPEPAGGPVAQIVVMVYRAENEKIVRSEVPFWFFRLKGSAARFALRGSGFDLDRLKLNPGDVAAHGPGIIFAEKTAGTDRVLVWAE